MCILQYINTSIYFSKYHHLHCVVIRYAVFRGIKAWKVLRFVGTFHVPFSEKTIAYFCSGESAKVWKLSLTEQSLWLRSTSQIFQQSYLNAGPTQNDWSKRILKNEPLILLKAQNYSVITVKLTGKECLEESVWICHVNIPVKILKIGSLTAL